MCIRDSLSTVPFWGVLLLLALGFAYEAMESVLCLVIIHHKKPDLSLIHISSLNTTG